MAFTLHERLAADTLALGQSSLCDIRLMNDSTWPWVLLVPRRSGIREIYELSDADQHTLMRESSTLGKGLMLAFGGDKLNIGALGNQVPQLHVHHIVRFAGDAAWPGPVWGRQAPVPYTEAGRRECLHILQPVIEAVRSVGA